MTRKETVRICDVCKKRVSDDGELSIGGHAHSGWFNLHMTEGSTRLEALKRQREWDVCSVLCLDRLVQQFQRALTK